MANTRQTVRTAAELAELAGSISSLIGQAAADGVDGVHNGQHRDRHAGPSHVDQAPGP
jgi:hypothetical protein